MTPELWQRSKPLFNSVLEKDERGAYGHGPWGSRAIRKSVLTSSPWFGLGSQVEFAGAHPLEVQLRVRPHANFALDTFPFRGMIAFESLWMGFPGADARGQHNSIDHASGLLGTLALHDWIAGSEKVYCEAVDLAVEARRPRRSAIRTTRPDAPQLAAECPAVCALGSSLSSNAAPLVQGRAHHRQMN